MNIKFKRDADPDKGDGMNIFPPAEDKLQNSIDSKINDILNESPSETRRVAENLEFMAKVSKHNIPKGKKLITAFGVETFDLHDIFKDMIWDRSIFTTDAIVNMCIETNIERMKKYLPKKTKMGFQYWWLILLLGVGVVVVILLLIFLLPQLGNMKLF
jgi:hypothetical protein